MESILAAVYPRVSSAGQRVKQSIAAQYDVAPVLASLSSTLGQPVQLAREPEHYADDGKSAATGKLDKRAGYARLLRDAEAGAFQLVIVYDLDRLSRSEDYLERAAIVGPLQRAGIRVADRNGTVYDMQTFQGDLMLTLKMTMAAEDNRRRVAGTKAGRLRAARAGKPPTLLPFGYRFDREAARHDKPAAECWALDPVTAPLVREIYTRILAGDSCETIAADFEARGIRRRRADKWTRGRVHTIATATTYRGEWKAIKRAGVTVAVPPIVDDETWHAAQLALSGGRTRGLRRTRFTYLCEQIAVCGSCGSPMGIHSTTAKGKVYRRYVCQRRLRGAFGERCDQPMLRVDDVDARLWASVRQLLDRPDLLNRAADRHAADAGAAARDWEADQADFERQLAEVERKLTVMAKQYAAGILPEAAYEAAAADLAQRRQLLQRQLETARTAVADAGGDIERMRALRGAVAQLRGKLDTADMTTRRELVRALVPGKGAHVVTLGPDKQVRAAVVVRASSLSKQGTRDTTNFECDFAVVA